MTSRVTVPGLPDCLVRCQSVLTGALADALPPPEIEPVDVNKSMRHTLLAPAKRVRGATAMLAAETCGGSAQRALGVGISVELVHAASLILDDLPCMDDAPVRRGMPSNHVAFGEATAILASFGLLTLAYRTLGERYEPPLAAALTAIVADAVGTAGLIGGQADDLLATSRAITFERLERIHRLKTGVLFSASARGGATSVNAAAAEVAALAAYAKNLGLAFQIVDDLLDVEGDPAETGKLTRQDAKKTTFVSFSGVAGARQLARELCETADRALAPFGARARQLRELSAFVAGRSG